MELFDRNKNKFKFTQIVDAMPYPPKFKAKLSVLHSDVVSYVQNHYNGSFKQRKKVVDTLNILSYLILSGDTIPYSWNTKDPLNNLPDVNSDSYESFLKQFPGMLLSERYIIWDLDIVETNVESGVEIKEDSVIPQSISSEDFSTPVTEPAADLFSSVAETPREDLYIRPPVVPRFNTSKVFASGMIGETQYVIYESYPIIPKKQNEISVTTDVDKMSDSDLIKLFPNQFIQTRSPAMYQRYEGIMFHDKLGSIIPVDGFSKDQLIDNIVRYPHLFRLQKCVDSQVVSFYPTIEISGELYRVSDVWNSLPESEIIPYNTEFVKEYVVRRYLLERDIKGVKHKYPLYGSLDPFLTLFTTSEDYKSLGYDDPIKLAHDCVTSRVSYKLTRNPVLQRLKNA